MRSIDGNRMDAGDGECVNWCMEGFFSPLFYALCAFGTHYSSYRVIISDLNPPEDGGFIGMCESMHGESQRQAGSVCFG